MSYRSPPTSPRAHPISQVRTSLFVAWLIGAGTTAALAQGGPTKVVVARAALVEVEPTMRLTGTILPRRRSIVASEVAGIVEELPVDRGDRVKQGDLLCKLRDIIRVAAHQEAIARRDELADTFEERKALLAKAEFERRRITALFETDRSTEKEMIDARADYDATHRRMKQAEHAVTAQEAVVRVLEENLRRTEIRAPFDGHIVMRRTEVGAWVEQGGEVVDMVDLSVVRVRVNAPESIVVHCTIDDPALVTVSALGEDFPARITRVVPDADERARTFPVEIDIENEDGRLRAGMFVQAAVPSGKKEPRLIVPKDAVLVRGSMRSLFVIRDGEQGPMAMPLPVEVFAEIEDKVAVDAPGLADGDRVVVRGNEYMFAPSPVLIMPEEPAPSAEKSVSDKTARAGGNG